MRFAYKCFTLQLCFFRKSLPVPECYETGYLSVAFNVFNVELPQSNIGLGTVYSERRSAFRSLPQFTPN
jgi:hypothetical protein